MIKEQILNLLDEKRELSVKEISKTLEVTKQGVHIALKQLMNSGEVEKFGRTPRTIYRLAEPDILQDLEEIYVNQDTADYLKKHFLMITELGELYDGIRGLSIWCTKRNLPVEKTISEFVKTRERYEKYFADTLVINGMKKLESTVGFEGIYPDQLFYLDFYAIERFGKTKLGTLLHFAKQAQNKFLMKKLVKGIKPTIDQLIKEQDFDAIAFVPPTIKRETQIMKYLEVALKINLPLIKIHKVSGRIPVPQKSLSRIGERINNAEKTFAVTDSIKCRHLLIIDDAVGSGATLNQIAGKIKRKNVAEKVSCLALVGSYKGFDVITDV